MEIPKKASTADNTDDTTGRNKLKNNVERRKTEDTETEIQVKQYFAK